MAKDKEYKKDFFIKMNMQNPPKPSSQMWYVRLADQDSVPYHTVVGYEFTTDKREDSIGIIEGFSEELNFRMAFLPRKGHYWVSRDFSGQELRILANVANEQTWIDTFLSGGDPHKATAITLWGEENYSKEKRKAAKAINFGLIYGKTAKSLALEIGVSVKEAQSYIDTFFEKLPSVKRFLDNCVREATQNLEIANLYGRKRRMKTYVDSWGTLSEDGKRRSYNHPIQSLGADIIKLALIKVYYKVIRNPEYEGLVFFLNTIHDEINTSVAYSVIEPVVFLLGETMEHIIPGKPVPIITELEIGHSMGLTWKFKQDPETLKLTPAYEPLEE